jgi:hypothetical protein
MTVAENPTLLKIFLHWLMRIGLGTLFCAGLAFLLATICLPFTAIVGVKYMLAVRVFFGVFWVLGFVRNTWDCGRQAWYLCLTGKLPEKPERITPKPTPASEIVQGAVIEEK